ncbi:DUF4179 domain-containing protein [Jeotgalibacillus proteolyticus]|uniref:DUF4179 domain-containing protein n=1 Tax=Jeotgalibacillus proteolyticus TaxID=2082395 RepID=UPI001430F678|nr:DUF4179 domain-containing protein [Jeotgalibacillus proteolyticus]
MDKKLKNTLNKQEVIPLTVRQTLDETYDSIRNQKRKRKRSVNRTGLIAAAASTFLIIGFAVSNDTVMAGINKFINFGDKGIEQAAVNGFIQDSDSWATDQGINITLESHFSDANKLGLSFQMEFEDPSMLLNTADVSMDYRLKNGDGEYIDEFIPDTKPLKGDASYISGSTHQNPWLDSKTGRVQYDVVAESNEGAIPPLKNAVIEIESINVFSNTGELVKIDGTWNLSVHNKEKSNRTATFTMQNESSVIQVSNATANPTSLNVSFAVGGIYEDENTFAEMKILDDKGNEYETNGFTKKTKNNQTIISANFPITSFSDSKKLMLMIEGIGEVELVKN